MQIVSVVYVLTGIFAKHRYVFGIGQEMRILSPALTKQENACSRYEMEIFHGEYVYSPIKYNIIYDIFIGGSLS